jgi:hypothetical protein
MKIEIELSEIEKLKEKLKQLEDEKMNLQKQLEALSERELISKAVNLSYKLFDNYMQAVFEKLGFEKWKRGSVLIDYNIENWFSKDWWNDKRLNVEICVDIRNKFKSAFLKIGVIPESELNKLNDYFFKLD